MRKEKLLSDQIKGIEKLYSEKRKNKTKGVPLVYYFIGKSWTSFFYLVYIKTTKDWMIEKMDIKDA